MRDAAQRDESITSIAQIETCFLKALFQNTRSTATTLWSPLNITSRSSRTKPTWSTRRTRWHIQAGRTQGKSLQLEPVQDFPPSATLVKHFRQSFVASLDITLERGKCGRTATVQIWSCSQLNRHIQASRTLDLSSLLDGAQGWTSGAGKAQPGLSRAAAPFDRC